ncbi:MAG: serine/threonine-protein kinase [Candidatus Xenobia bacterium]
METGVETTVPVIPGYRLSRLLGEGSYAQVWAAVQVSTGQQVAVKVLQLAGDGLSGEVARLVSVSEHPNVLSVIDASASHEPPYLITPLLAGSLEDVAKGTPLTTIVQWMIGVAEALQYIHRKGIVHCDLKAANILLDREGLVKVVDFGQAQLEGEENVALGTFWHMPPEQAVIPLDGDTHVIPDVGWDIYALGATFYRILTGQFPRAHEKVLETGSVIDKVGAYRKHLQAAPLVPIRQLNPEVDADLAEVVEHCLQIEPHRRYQSAASVLEDLRRRASGEPLLCHPSSRRYVLGRNLRRHFAVVGLTTLLVLTLCFGILSLWQANSQIQRERDAARRENSELKYERGLDEIGKGDASGATLLAEALQHGHDQRVLESVIGQLHAIPHLVGTAMPHTSRRWGPEIARDGRILIVDGNRAVIQPGGVVLPAGGEVRRAVFNHAGDRVALVEAGGQVSVWNAHGEMLKRWDAAATTCAFSPGAPCLVTGGGTAVRFWDLAGTPQGGPIQTAGSEVVEVHYLDADRVLIAARDRLMVATSTRVLASRVVPYWLDLGLSPGRVLIGLENSQARELALPTLVSRGSYGDAGNGNVWMARYSPDGSRVMLAVDDTVNLYDAASRRRIATTGSCAGDIRAAAWAPNGRAIACGLSTGQVSLFDAPGGSPGTVSQCIVLGCSLNVVRQVDDVRFFPHGRRLLVLAANGTATVWDNLYGYRLLQEVHHDGEVGRAEFSPDGRLVLSQSRQEARLWEAASGKTLVDARPRDGQVQAAHFAPDGKTFAVVTNKGEVALWDTSGHSTEGAVPNGLTDCAFIPDGSALLLAGDDGLCRLWDWRHRKELRVFPDTGSIHSVAFSPDGRLLLTGGESGHATLWDVHSGEMLGRLPHQDWVMQVAFSPDGQTMATASLDATAALWDVPSAASGTPLRPRHILRHPDQVWRLAFSPDGRRLATACANFSANLWDVASGRPICEGMRHKGTVSWVAFSPDGHRLATASSDDTARVWLCPAGDTPAPPRPLTPPLRHHDPVNSVAFSPTGDILLTASAGGTARLWDIHLDLSQSRAAVEQEARRAAGLSAQ